MTCGAWGSAGPGTRLGSLRGQSAEAPAATCAPGARQRPGSQGVDRAWQHCLWPRLPAGLSHDTEKLDGTDRLQPDVLLWRESSGLGDVVQPAASPGLSSGGEGPVLAAGQAHPCPPQQTVPRRPAGSWGHLPRGCLIRGPALHRGASDQQLLSPWISKLEFHGSQGCTSALLRKTACVTPATAAPGLAGPTPLGPKRQGAAPHLPHLFIWS